MEIPNGDKCPTLELGRAWPSVLLSSLSLSVWSPACLLMFQEEQRRVCRTENMKFPECPHGMGLLLALWIVGRWRENENNADFLRGFPTCQTILYTYFIQTCSFCHTPHHCSTSTLTIFSMGLHMQLNFLPPPLQERVSDLWKCRCDLVTPWPNSFDGSHDLWEDKSPNSSPATRYLTHPPSTLSRSHHTLSIAFALLSYSSFSVIPCTSVPPAHAKPF